MSNFQAVREIIDQKNEAGFPETLAMVGVIKEFKGEGINEKTSKPYKKVSIKDDSGELHNVTLRGTLPSVSLAGQRAQFSISSYNGSYDNKSYIGYSGFWNDKVDVQQQSTQQAPSQASEDKKSESSSIDITESHGRCAVVCAAIQSRQITVESEIDCDKWVQYIILGHNAPPPAQQTTIDLSNPSPPDDDIPF